MLEIDGSFGESGGQILRTAIALSAITEKPCHLFNIRRLRSNPGLANQHLASVGALACLCNGKVEGDKLGSNEIKFWPGKIEQGKKSISIRLPTASSITLVLQSLILPALFSKEEIEINIEGGATDTFFSPTIDYFEKCFLEVLKKIGIKIDLDVFQKGYYPQGGAKIRALIYPSKINGINLTKRGELKRIFLLSSASELLEKKNVAQRQIAGAKEIIGKLNLPIEERLDYYQTECPGSQVCLIGEFENTLIGTDSLGKLGKRAEDVGKEAALELLGEEKTKACFDKHLSDQILPYMALSKKESIVTTSKITDHCKTNIWTIEKFLPGNFKIKEPNITWTPN
jgi:RNA 3'-phosphate cyclase